MVSTEVAVFALILFFGVMGLMAMFPAKKSQRTSYR